MDEEVVVSTPTTPTPTSDAPPEEHCAHKDGKLATNGFPSFVIGYCTGCACTTMYTNVHMWEFDDRIEVEAGAGVVTTLQKTESTVIYVPPEPEPAPEEPIEEPAPEEPIEEGEPLANP